VIEIFETLYSHRQKDTHILSVLKKAYDEDDEITLLKLRALTIKELDFFILDSQCDDEEREIIEDLQKLLAHSNLHTPIRQQEDLITKGHLATLKALNKHKKHTLNYQTKEELQTLLQNAPKEDDAFIKELINATEEFLEEFRIIGNNAYKNFYYKVISIIALYKNDIQASKNQNFAQNIYTKAKEGLEVTEVFEKLCNTTIKFLEMIN